MCEFIAGEAAVVAGMRHSVHGRLVTNCPRNYRLAGFPLESKRRPAMTRCAIRLMFAFDVDTWADLGNIHMHLLIYLLANIPIGVIICCVHKEVDRKRRHLSDTYSDIFRGFLPLEI